MDLTNQRWIFSETESKTDMPRIVYLTDEALAITRRSLLRYPKWTAFPKSQQETLDDGRRELRSSRVQIKLAGAGCQSVILLAW